MRITFVYPAFERHAQAHPELREYVPADEYLGPPSLGIAGVAACTPDGHEIAFVDDRLTPVGDDLYADLVALSVFTPGATRALELADRLRANGRKVVLGGIFPTALPDVAQAHADAVVVGEGEPVWPQLVADAAEGRLRARYQAPAPADLEALPPPRVDLYLAAERDGHRPDDYPLQISRGCPMTCDACMVPGVMDRKIRFFGPDYLAATIKAFSAAGKRLSLTEDTSAFPFQGARRRFRTFLDQCAALRREGVNLRLSYLGISMPMLLNLEDSFYAELRAQEMDRFYVVGGFDPITRRGFGTGDPEALRQAEEAVRRCQDEGLSPYTSFLVGNPDDDEGVFDRMLEFGHRTKLDLAEFAIATPYPGTPVWHRYEAEGRIFDYTWKRYNDANVVFRPHRMSPERLLEGYLYLWREFYRGRGADMDGRAHDRRTIQF
jgi:radical SAM superfamily enzyme YgiQ (UPF0313 family)